MKITRAKASIYLDRTHPKQNGECAVYIRVTHNRQRKYFPAHYSLSPIDFERAITDKPGKKLEDISHSLQALKVKATDIIKSMNVFSFDVFKRRFLTEYTSLDTISLAFDLTINKLNSNDQIGTAVSYNCAKRSLAAFRSDLKFSDINVSFLQSYEKWMLENGKSTTTISMYLRHLRTLFNDAIEQGLITKELYPFGKRRYEIPHSNNVKKALTLKEIGLIYNYKVKPKSNRDRAKGYWLFMYFSNGMNVKDMARLKYENIAGEVIQFTRAKTVRTKRTVENIRVVITPQIRSIIEKFGNKKKEPSNFIFPILTKGITAERERQLIQQVTGVINDHIKIIAQEVGIDQHVTTYTCRHSFATILQRSGISVEFISEALGHSSLRTTQAYLKGFEDSKRQEAAKLLSAF